MNYWHLTEPYFQQFKQDYTIYGVTMQTDDYGNEYAEKNEQPKAVINTMWHPLDDRLMIAEYGRDFDKVLYAIIYDMPATLTYGDRVEIYGEQYEISSIRKYNTHTRIDVKRLKAVTS